MSKSIINSEIVKNNLEQIIADYKHEQQTILNSKAFNLSNEEKKAINDFYNNLINKFKNIRKQPTTEIFGLIEKLLTSDNKQSINRFKKYIDIKQMVKLNKSKELLIGPIREQYKILTNIDHLLEKSDKPYNILSIFNTPYTQLFETLNQQAKDNEAIKKELVVLSEMSQTKNLSSANNIIYKEKHPQFYLTDQEKNLILDLHGISKTSTHNLASNALELLNKYREWYTTEQVNDVIKNFEEKNFN